MQNNQIYVYNEKTLYRWVIFFSGFSAEPDLPVFSSPTPSYMCMIQYGLKLNLICKLFTMPLGFNARKIHRVPYHLYELIYIIMHNGQKPSI